MNRTRTYITVAAFLASFAWLLAPGLKASTAVLWPDIEICEAFLNASSPASAHHAPTFRHECCNNNVSDLPVCVP